MINLIWNFIFGKDHVVTIVRLGHEYGGWQFEHTVVKLEDGRVRYVNGHLGSPGDKITVSSWDLNSF